MATTDSVRSQAWQSHQNGQQTVAEQLYRELLKHKAEEVDVVNLGALLRSQGRLKEALKHYQVWLPQFRASQHLALNAINCAIEAKDFALAEQFVLLGQQSNPQEPALQQAQARLLQAQGHGEQSISLLQRLSQSNPSELTIWLDLGLAHHRFGQADAALQAFDQATRLNPLDPRPVANTITVLSEQGKLDAAQAFINGLPAALRGQGEVRGAVAHHLMERQLMVEAAEEFAQLCVAEPGQPLHWLNRTACLRQLKQSMAALSVAKRGVILHPNHDDLRHALGQCLAETGRQQQAMNLLLPKPDSTAQLPRQHLFNLQFLGAGYGLITAERRAAMARHWELEQQEQGVGALWGDRIQEPLNGRPLRVGYLSADFCNHPVGRFLLPVLEAHDPSAVAVVGLSCGPHSDTLQASLKEHCQHWIDLRHMGDLEAARLVSDLNLDVVVELGGYTAGSRLGILCHRPAPVQLSYLGYFAPTYLTSIDGWIGDSVLFGGLEHCDANAHQLLHVQGGYMAYHDDALPQPARTAAPQLRFGSFNHARKLSAEAVALFCEVMAAVPTAELVLKSISFVEAAEQDRMRSLFAEAGLASDRLVLLPWVQGRAAHLGCYQEIDVALDPLPYGGATTTCEALAMGVPVITLAGAGMVGRLSASVLAHAGCNSWIAANKDDYVSIAAALATAGPRGPQQRLALRQQVLASDLGDGQRLARELERHYRTAAARVLKARSK
jgi:predicted O-linked N-acetylglucosamine transferase (SPINDLY family)